ncbi:MAG: hypothetical protein OHK0053_14240 [Microscillaceae bacterium]
MLHKIHYLEQSLPMLIKSLQAEKFDFVIDLHQNLRSNLLKWRLGARVLTYRKYLWARWLLVHFKINRGPFRHWVDIFWDTVKPLGVVNDGQGLDFFIAPQDEVPPSHWPYTHQAGFVAFVIGASEFTKKLPLEKKIEICRRLHQPIALVGGPEDRSEGDLMASALPQQAIWNTCGSFRLGQSASLVQQADYVVGHDTGLTHIAAAFKKKIYAIYGGTLSQYLYPYGTESVIIEHPNLACRPCAKAGRADCPKGHFKCMLDLRLEDYFGHETHPSEPYR